MGGLTASIRSCLTHSSQRERGSACLDEKSPAANGTTTGSTPGTGDEYPYKTVALWGTAFPLAFSALVFAAGAFAVGGVAWLLDKNTQVGTEVILPILLIYGVVTLLVAIGVLASIIPRSQQSQVQSGALGLPEGSVPAVIALILVLIFAITAVFLATIPPGG